MAQRCFAALGNASKAFYLSETVKIAENYEETNENTLECPEVRVRLALLDANLRFIAKKFLVEMFDNSMLLHKIYLS